MDERTSPISEEIPHYNSLNNTMASDETREKTEENEQMKHNYNEDENQSLETKPYNPFIQSQKEKSFEENSVSMKVEEDLIELQYQYDDLMSLYQESIERANSLQSSLLLKDMKMRSIEIQIKSVIDELRDQKANGSDELNHPIQSLQSMIDSLSQEPMLDYDSEKPISSIEENTSLDTISTSVDLLENYVQENNSLIETLKDLPITYGAEIDDLRARLSVLYKANILLNDVIDSNNQHVGELSHVINEKSQQLHQLREAEIAYKEETQSGVSEVRKQMQELQNMLYEEQAYSQQLEVALDQQATRGPADETMVLLQKQLEEAEATICYLRNELQRQSDEQLFETTVGQFSTLNPTAIIACIEGLVSRVSLAEAKAKSSEVKIRSINEGSEEKIPSSLEEVEKLNCQYQQMVTKLQNRLAKYKKNEKTYRQLLFGMKEAIKSKEKQLLSVYSIINGVSKYIVK